MLCLLLLCGAALAAPCPVHKEARRCTGIVPCGRRRRCCRVDMGAGWGSAEPRGGHWKGGAGGTSDVTHSIWRSPHQCDGESDGPRNGRCWPAPCITYACGDLSAFVPRFTRRSACTRWHCVTGQRGWERPPHRITSQSPLAGGSRRYADSLPWTHYFANLWSESLNHYQGVALVRRVARSDRDPPRSPSVEVELSES